MTRIQNHPRIKQMRLQFAIEGFLLILFTVFYYGAFDGATKPLWSNLLLIGSTSAYILVRFSGWLLLRNPIQDTNLKGSLGILQKRQRRLALLTVLTSTIFGISFLLFFSTTITFTQTKWFILGGASLLFIFLVVYSSMNWKTKIKDVDRTISELL